MSSPGLSYKYLTAKITSGQSLSAAVPILNLHVIGFVMPAAWDAAALTFQGSIDGVTFNNGYDANGTEIAVQAAASRYIVVSPLTLPATKQLIVRSGTSGTAVNQTADRQVTIVCREYA